MSQPDARCGSCTRWWRTMAAEMESQQATASWVTVGAAGGEVTAGMGHGAEVEAGNVAHVVAGTCRATHPWLCRVQRTGQCSAAGGAAGRAGHFRSHAAVSPSRVRLFNRKVGAVACIWTVRCGAIGLWLVGAGRAAAVHRRASASCAAALTAPVRLGGVAGLWQGWRWRRWRRWWGGQAVAGILCGHSWQ